MTGQHSHSTVQQKEPEKSSSNSILAFGKAVDKTITAIDRTLATLDKILLVTDDPTRRNMMQRTYRDLMQSRMTLVDMDLELQNTDRD